MQRKAVSPVIAILLSIAIAISIGILVYAWITGYIGIITKTQTGVENLIIESYYKEGNLLTAYVRNVGGVDAIINSTYLVDNGVYQLQPAIITTGTEIWPGGTWKINKQQVRVELETEGKIRYDIGDSFNDSSFWNDDYVDYNNYWDAIYYDPEGLKLLSRSNGGWAVRGLISNDKVIDLSKRIVIEVDLQKTNYNVPGGDAAASPFAACLYISPNKNSKNPFDNAPWFAVKLYPKGWPITDRTVAQVVTRDTSNSIKYEDLDTWYSAPNTQPRGIFLLIFDPDNDRAEYYFWKK